IKQRVEGLSKAQAKKTLREDRKALATWIQKGGEKLASASFVFGWISMSAAPLLGINAPLESISEMLRGMPAAPPGRIFGPLPEIEPHEGSSIAIDGNVFLYVSNSSCQPPTIDVRVAIDG